MSFGALGFQLATTPATKPTNSGFSLGSLASGASGIASGLINSLITPNYNKPEYSPNYYVDANALFPNGVPTQTQKTTPTGTPVAVSSNANVLYGGLGLAAIVLFLTVRNK